MPGDANRAPRVARCATTATSTRSRAGGVATGEPLTDTSGERIEIEVIRSEPTQRESGRRRPGVVRDEDCVPVRCPRRRDVVVAKAFSATQLSWLRPIRV